MTRIHFFTVASCLLALLSGCEATRAFDRASAWHPLGINDANLAAMVVNPADLVHGRGTGDSDGQAAAAAVHRLRSDHVKPLSGASGNGGSDASGGDASGGAAAGSAALGGASGQAGN
jgi:hypothetical protein